MAGWTAPHSPIPLTWSSSAPSRLPEHHRLQPFAHHVPQLPLRADLLETERVEDAEEEPLLYLEPELGLPLSSRGDQGLPSRLVLGQAKDRRRQSINILDGDELDLFVADHGLDHTGNGWDGQTPSALLCGDTGAGLAGTGKLKT